MPPALAAAGAFVASSILGSAAAGTAAFAAIATITEIVITAGVRRRSDCPLNFSDFLEGIARCDAPLNVLDGYDPRRRVIGPVQASGLCQVSLGITPPCAVLIDPFLQVRDGDLALMDLAAGDVYSGKVLRLLAGRWWLVSDNAPPVPVQAGDRALGRIVASMRINPDTPMGRYALARTAQVLEEHQADHPVWNQLRELSTAAREQLAACRPGREVFQIQLPGRNSWRELEARWPLTVPGKLFGAVGAVRESLAAGATPEELSALGERMERAGDYLGGLTLPA